MDSRARLVGCLLVPLFVLAAGCAGSSDDGAAAGDGQAGALSGGTSLRNVEITVSAKQTGETYEARSYPNDDFDGDGQIELYKAPIYFVYVDGVDASGTKVRREWKAPRFMPYYNDPSDPDPEYKTHGFITAGLSAVAREAIGVYKPDYEVHNTFSPFGGAIVVQGSFYIHAGPADLTDIGWGSAGCVEVLGNFDKFKTDILELAGSSATDLNKGMSQLVAARKLFVTYEQAQRPNLKAAFSRQIAPKADDQDDAANDSTTDRSDPNG